MIYFVYLNYGPRESFRLELKYSFLTLRPFLDPTRHRVAIYADAPDRFARWPVTAVSIAGKIDEYSGGGRFNHRIKLMVLRDALQRFGEPAVLLDSDSIVFDGFVASVAEKLERQAIMNAFETRDPIPKLTGFETVLPHARYRYDPASSRMYNSGLIGARPDYAPIVEDAIALTDAFLDQPVARDRHFQLEQFAIAEAFRIHGVGIGEIPDTFFHYWRRSLRRYAQYRLPKILPAEWNDVSAPTAELTFGRLKVRGLAAWRSVMKRTPHWT